jgi:hypothetical protein
MKMAAFKIYGTIRSVRILQQSSPYPAQQASIGEPLVYGRTTLESALLARKILAGLGEPIGSRSISQAR